MWWSLAGALALAATFCVQALRASNAESLTWDEPSFASAGYTYLTLGDFRLNPSHPPLMQDLAALPLVLMGVRPPEADLDVFDEEDNPVVAYGEQLFFGAGNDPVRMARWMRLPAILLGTGLVFAVWAWGRRLFGPVAALLGAGAAAFCPNLLAHGHLATEDVGCSALMFVAIWTLWRATHGGSVGAWLVCGLATGLALIAKYTALLLGPIDLLLAGWVLASRRSPATARALAAGGAAIVVLSALVVAAAYGPPFGLATYVQGMSRIYTDMSSGNSFYLLGEVSAQPWWYYHLVALALKTPVPTLALVAWAAARALRDPARRDTAVFLLVPAGTVLLTSCFDQLNIGVRRVLPAVPFLLALVPAAVAGARGRLAPMLATALVLGTAVEVTALHPHYLSYFNRLAGGPANGPFLLDDSNLDWGQDLPALARWQVAHPDARPMRLLYFGMADPAAYGVDADMMEPAEIFAPRPGWYAVSVHQLVWFRKIARSTGHDVDWLVRYQPVERAGWSIWLYRFD